MFFVWLFLAYSIRHEMKEKQKSGYAWIPSRFMYGGIARFYKREHDYYDD
jgi:hypothetical protein